MNRSLRILVLSLCGQAVAASLYAASTDTAVDLFQSSSAVIASTISVVTSSTSLMESNGKAIHALHVTAWLAGSKKYRAHLNEVFKTTVVNAVVIDVKEYEGEVYIPGVKMADNAKAYVPAMPDIATWVADLKHQGIYTVARIVVFKDNIMPRKNKSLAVKNPQGEVWQDHHHITWLDPYNPEAGRYNLLIALEAAKIGFDEVQFDYIRFPTDGSLSQMRFAQPYDKKAAPHALISFLQQARQLLHPLGTKISIDVFGLTTTVNTGMGIGQLLKPMTEQVDFVCPMVYPSHYASGEYGIATPNNQPYKIISIALHDAITHLGPTAIAKLRPYLQDFSLKNPKKITTDANGQKSVPDHWIRYGKNEVRAQMQAGADLGVMSWTLWNARCSYTLDALKSPIIPVPKTPLVETSSSVIKTPPK